MSITIEDLLRRVALFRGDDFDETVCVQALLEATRNLLRATGIYKVTLDPVVLAANTMSYSPSIPTGYDLVSINSVRLASIEYSTALLGDQYLGTWDAQANSPTMPSATTKSGYEFYIVSNSGTTTVDSITTWNTGDIVLNSTSVWTKIAREEYLRCNEINEKVLNSYCDQTQSGRGFPYYFSQQNGTIKFYDPPKNDIAIEVELSLVPSANNEITSIDIPIECQDAIVYGALEFIYAMPGKGQNLNLSELNRVRFNKAKTNMRILSKFGKGPLYYKPASFTGR